MTAEEAKGTPEKSTPTKANIDWPKLQSKLDAIEKHITTLAGKEGVNPFIWARDNKLSVLKQQALNKNEACVSAIEALPLKPDCKVVVYPDKSKAKKPVAITRDAEA